jgi:hypothetical protein
MLGDAGLGGVSVVFFGDTANLPYGTKTQERVASLSDAMIGRLSPYCPVLGIACNTASAALGPLRAGGQGRRADINRRAQRCRGRRSSGTGRALMFRHRADGGKWGVIILRSLVTGPRRTPFKG